ncbi:erythromycin esterase family protein [Glycomyces terrestris]|uniref:Erythromycin esterase family protein n=1 Tax=Glycomyces terrestris TaxID=2493553 RepID=A0A426UWA6_9ACTN|nr:erythromycin esterase family protein [Glycomyces terrestris]RRR98604.1 erythromycin esterase family protein [Glycomyces terrestris]
MEHRHCITGSHELIGLGEHAHGDSALADARLELFTRLVEGGVRSIAFESDRVAALIADDYVQGRAGTLDSAAAEGITHGFGAFDVNRRLLAWLREHNEGRAPRDRVAFHGMDAPLEFTAASPRAYLEHVRDYLGRDLDLTEPCGDDERWSRTEAVVDPAASPGDTPAAHRLRVVADDLLAALDAEAPRLIAATSRTDWDRARIHATTALGLLRYHRQAAQPLEESERWSRLASVRDALMARNLLDIRATEAERGPTAVFAHNIHLQRTESRMEMAGMNLAWSGAGAIVAVLLGPKYVFVAGTLAAPEDRHDTRADTRDDRSVAGGGSNVDFGGADAILRAGDGEPTLTPARPQPE